MGTETSKKRFSRLWLFGGAVLIAAASVAFTSACSLNVSPQDTTAIFFECIKTGDTEAIDDVYSGDTTAILDPTSELAQLQAQNAATNSASNQDSQGSQDNQSSQNAENAQQAGLTSQATLSLGSQSSSSSAANAGEAAATDTSSDAGSTSGSNLTSLTSELLRPKLLDFDYELSNEQIDEDTATVDAEITTYQFGECMQAFFTNYINQGLSMVLTGATQEDLSDLAESLLTEQIGELDHETKTYTTDMTISLTRTDGVWKVDDMSSNNEFYDALTGGLISSFATLDETIESQTS